MAGVRLALSVRNVAGEDSIRLSANLRGRVHHLLRDKTEPVSKALRRIAIAAAKSAKTKKNVRSKQRALATAPEINPIQTQLHVGSATGPTVAQELPNADAWTEGNVLVVDDAQYDIRVNPPTVLSLKLPNFLMTGSPIVPEVCVYFTFGNHPMLPALFPFLLHPGQV